MLHHRWYINLYVVARDLQGYARAVDTPRWRPCLCDTPSKTRSDEATEFSFTAVEWATWVTTSCDRWILSLSLSLSVCEYVWFVCVRERERERVREISTIIKWIHEVASQTTTASADWTQSAAKLLAVTMRHNRQLTDEHKLQLDVGACLCDIRTFTLSIVSINWIHRRTTHFWLSSTTTKFSDVSHVLGVKTNEAKFQPSPLTGGVDLSHYHCTALPLPVHHCFLVVNLKCAILC